MLQRPRRIDLFARAFGIVFAAGVWSLIVGIFVFHGPIREGDRSVPHGGPHSRESAIITNVVMAVNAVLIVPGMIVSLYRDLRGDLRRWRSGS